MCNGKERTPRQLIAALVLWRFDDDGRRRALERGPAADSQVCPATAYALREPHF
jgi:hypothetical protein